MYVLVNIDLNIQTKLYTNCDYFRFFTIGYGGNINVIVLLKNEKKNIDCIFQKCIQSILPYIHRDKKNYKLKKKKKQFRPIPVKDLINNKSV